jgi:SAM-dependent methyltransferase
MSSTLPSMPWRELPMVGAIRNPQKDVVGLFDVDLAGKSVLCIGYTEAELAQFVAPHHPASVQVLTKWDDHEDSKVKRYPLTVGDLCERTPFADAQFDCVMMLSVMEHLQDLSAALAETRRLLRRDGELLTFFGPAWSCPYGHHLYLQGGHPLLDFSQCGMPAYLHLLCSQDEVRRFVLDNGLIEDYVPWFVRMFWEDPMINRLMFEEYPRAFGEQFQLVGQSTCYCEVPREFVALLRRKYAPFRDFSSYGGAFRLKPA